LNPQGTKYRRILSPLRLPVPPSRLFVEVLDSTANLLVLLRCHPKRQVCNCVRNCVGFRRFSQLFVLGHETLYRRFSEPIAKSLESTRSRFYHSSELLSFDFTRSGRLSACELKAKRCVFRSPYRILRNFTQCNRSADLPSPPPADREFFYRSSTTRAAFGTAGKGSPASRFFTSPDLIALHRIYTIALYVNYPIQSYDF
jgi:hypothetical protein